MDEQIKNELRRNKVSEMKCPVILMNEVDFKIFKDYIESKSTIKISDNPTFEGVSIRINNVVQKGNVIIYDSYLPSWHIRKPE